MKILIDARMYGLENTGIGRYLMNLISELQRLDKENVYAILLRRKYFESLTFQPNFKKVLANFGVYSFSEQIGLLKILYKEKPDLSHFPHFNVPVLFKGNYVVTLHDMTMHKSGRESSNLPLVVFWVKKFVYKTLYSCAVNNSVKIIVPSNAVKRDVLDSYNRAKNKTETIYEGVDQNFIDVDKKKSDSILKKYGLKENKYLIYTGNVYPHKNIKQVVAALKLLRDDNIPLRLVVVTKKDKFSKQILDFAKEKGIEEDIVLTGFVADFDLKKLYKYSLAFIYPSLMEGFGLQGLEALASGTKLLASDIPVFREIYENFASYFDPYNPYSIANVIKKSLDSKRIQGISKFLKEYSWKKMGFETLKVYNLRH